MPAVHENKRAPEVLRREDAAPAGNRPGYSEADPSRPRVAGKFLFAGERKLYVRGVTYGPFRPDAHGSEYHDRITVERDFAQMEAIGINAVRTYTIPPEWLLEIAQEHRIGVLIGWPWEQHVAFLDSRKRERDL